MVKLSVKRIEENLLNFIKNTYIIPITITSLNVGKYELSLSPFFFIIVHRLEVQLNVL